MDMTGERGHQFRAVGEMQVHRLAGQARCLRDLRHADCGVTSLANQSQRGIQDAGPRVRS